MVRNRGLAGSQESHPQGRAVPLEGILGSLGQSRSRKYAKDQKGKIKKQMPGSDSLSVKPRACFSMTLGRPGFLGGS